MIFQAFQKLTLSTWLLDCVEDIEMMLKSMPSISMDKIITSNRLLLPLLLPILNSMLISTMANACKEMEVETFQLILEKLNTNTTSMTNIGNTNVLTLELPINSKTTLEEKFLSVSLSQNGNAMILTMKKFWT